MAIEVNQLLAGDAFFDELLAVNDNPVIVADGPEATVKLPVCVFGKGQAVAGVVVAAVAELVNMSGVHNALHVESRHAVASQGYPYR